MMKRKNGIMGSISVLKFYFSEASSKLIPTPTKGNILSFNEKIGFFSQKLKFEVKNLPNLERF